MQNENNKVHIAGEICSKFEYSNSVYGEKFYTVFVSITRKSGTVDILPVMVSSRMIFNLVDDLTGTRVEIFGSFRSYNLHSEAKNQTILYIWADTFDIENVGGEDENSIELYGFICREPVYRTTPLKKEITDMILAVNRPNNKSDYLPVIAWGRNAAYLSNFSIGSEVIARGRIQSRGYTKMINEVSIRKIAYEVSILRLEDVRYGSENDRQEENILQ